MIRIVKTAFKRIGIVNIPLGKDEDLRRIRIVRMLPLKGPGSSKLRCSKDQDRRRIRIVRMLPLKGSGSQKLRSGIVKFRIKRSTLHS